MTENQSNFVKDVEIYKPLIHKTDSIIDNCIRDCHNGYFDIFANKGEHDIELTNVRNNEVFNLTVSDKSMGLCELNKKIKNARQNDFISNQLNKPTKKFSSNLSNINICYYLKFRPP